MTEKMHHSPLQSGYLYGNLFSDSGTNFRRKSMRSKIVVLASYLQALVRFLPSMKPEVSLDPRYLVPSVHMGGLKGHL